MLNELVILIGVCWSLLALAIPAVGQSAQDSVRLEKEKPVQVQLAETIEKVRTSESFRERMEGSDRLGDLTRDLAPEAVDETTLVKMISLLDTENDQVRARVAIALGNLGPRAKAAAPKLLEILPEVDCIRADVPSSMVYRAALRSVLGATPPEPSCNFPNSIDAMKQQLLEAIEKIRTSAPSIARTQTARRLWTQTIWLRTQVDKSTISDLASLLQIPDDSVRGPVAIALGVFGSRATMAIPELRKILSQAECRRGSRQLADDVRQALERIDAKPSPPKCSN